MAIEAEHAPVVVEAGNQSPPVRECAGADCANQQNENLPGKTRYGAGGTTPDEYGKRGGQDVKRGVANHTPIVRKPEISTGPSTSTDLIPVWRDGPTSKE